MISQQTIQQILSRIDIIEIVGSFIKLKKRGTNYLGLCPFHNEKSPSFTVSPAKEIYKCFGCGKSGNTISFIMEHEKYSYAEALRWLANKYNVTIEETELAPELKAQQQVADSLYIINSFAQKFFSQQLLQTEEGTDIALSYLKHRGFREEIIEKFQLGYNPQDRNSFATAALKNQFGQENLLKTGTVVLRNDELVDNYRGRIIFPVHNNSGKIIGFGARLIKNNDKAPKYINTPENELYVKSKILYGTYFARQAIDKNDECLLVEGYTDVISLHQAGIENVVASGGTSLTQDQLRLIKKYSNNLTIIYDGDNAGIKAALRGLDMALEEGLNVKLVLIPDKEDPDSYVNKVGAAAFREFIAANKKDFILFQLEVALKDAGQDSQKKATVVNQVAETISKINKAEDFTKQQDYIRKCSELLKIDETGLNALVNKFIREKVSKTEAKQTSAAEQEVGATDQPPLLDEDSINLLFADELQERAVVRALLEFGLKPWDEDHTIASYMFEHLIEEDFFDNKQLLHIITTYKTWYEAGIEPTAKNFLYHEDQALSTLVVSIMDFPYELSEKWKTEFEMPVITREQVYREEVKSTASYLKLRKIKRMIIQNQQDLEKSTNAEEQFVYMQTHQHLKQLEQEIVKQSGTVIIR
ncbi:MAG: DNA primase [Sphingobacteriales bacterium]|nr:MAG: DNA primase [Sphingobacteriales bacterium]